ncbi:MAG: DUF6599 family protein [Thermodesulfobacteriota bacterium]
MNRGISTLLLFLILTTGSIPMTIERSLAGPLEDLGSLLPTSFGEWKTEGGDRYYDVRSIFDYIDGAGEVYRAYHMRGCLSRRYAGARGASLVLDVFDMGSSDDAFGVFTHDREGDPVDLGQGGLFKSGWLRFWKGRFFVSVFDETQSAASAEGTRILAGAVSDLIREPGPVPVLVSRLPAPGLETRSVRYLHDPVVLNTHFYLSDENILHLDSGTEAALATYQREGARVTLLLVQYPDVEKSRQAYGSLMKHYLPDADAEGVAQLEDRKWAGAMRLGRLLAAILEAGRREPVRRLLTEVLEAAGRP